MRLTRAGILADYFPPPFPNEEAARANNGGALPPDLSLIVKAREGGAALCLFDPHRLPQDPAQGLQGDDGKYYNPYFEGWNISMPPPLADNAVTYSDGTKATVDQEAHDVVTFLAWASEPKMEERKRIGFGVLIFLVRSVGPAVRRLSQGLGRRALDRHCRGVACPPDLTMRSGAEMLGGCAPVQART